MEPFKSFQIESLELDGFKTYGERTLIECYPHTMIIGGNHQGKSSLADAIAFAVTGLTFFGEHRIDRLYSDKREDRSLEIVMTFRDDRGERHQLIRRRIKDKMSMYLDRCDVTQAELSNLFGESDLFLAILNPHYIVEVLEAKDHRGRKLLERYLRVVPKEEVLTAMGAMGALLEDMDLLSPDGDLKKVRDEIREQEDSRTYFEGQLDYCATRERTQRETKKDLTDKLAETGKELEALEQKRASGCDIPVLEERVAVLQAQYDELVSDNVPPPDAGAASAALEDASAMLTAIESAQYTFEEAGGLVTIQAEIRELYARHSRESKAKAGLQSGTACPTCRRPITQQELPEIEAAYDVILAGIVRDGLEKKAQATALQEKERAGRTAFEEARAGHRKDAQAKLDAARKHLAGLNEAYRREVAAHQKQLAELETAVKAAYLALEQGGLTEEEFLRREELRAQVSACRDQLAALNMPEEDDGKVPDPQRGLNYAAEKLAELKKQEEALLRYIAVKNGLLADQLQMNQVSITLFEPIKKTGEAKDVFSFSYEGRSYVSLSLSEKLRAGLELSGLMARLSGRNYPVFIDNVESVECIDTAALTGQVFLCSMVARADLKVYNAADPAMLRQILLGPQAPQQQEQPAAA